MEISEKRAIKRKIKDELNTLRKRADEREKWLYDNTNNDRFQEVLDDYHAILIKIETKRAQILELDSTKKIQVSHYSISPGIKFY